MIAHAVITGLNGADHELITWLSCTDDVPQETIIKELSMHESRNQQAIIMDFSGDDSFGSAGNNQAAEKAGITRLSWQFSSRCAGRNHAGQLAIIKQMSRQVSHSSAGNYQADEQVESRSSAGNYQADEQVGITELSWQLSSR